MARKETFAGYSQPTAQMILAEILKLQAAGYIPRGGTNRPLQTPINTPLFVKNTESEAIPKFGCMQAIGTEEISGQNYLLVAKPADVDGSGGPFLFNLFNEIEATNGLGVASAGPIVRAVGGGTAAAGAKYQPTVGSWTVQSGGSLLTAIGPDDISANVGRFSTAPAPFTCAELFALIESADCDLCQWICENCDPPFGGGEIVDCAPPECCGQSAEPGNNGERLDCSYPTATAVTNARTTGGFPVPDPNDQLFQTGPSSRDADSTKPNCAFNVPMASNNDPTERIFTVFHTGGGGWSVVEQSTGATYTSTGIQTCSGAVSVPEASGPTVGADFEFDIAGENCITPYVDCCFDCEFTEGVTLITNFSLTSRIGVTYSQNAQTPASRYISGCQFLVETQRSDNGQPAIFTVTKVDPATTGGRSWEVVISDGTNNEQFVSQETACNGALTQFQDEIGGGSLSMTVSGSVNPCPTQSQATSVMMSLSATSAPTGPGDVLRQQSPDLFTGCNGCSRRDVQQLMNSYGEDSLLPDNLERFVDTFDKARRVTLSREEIQARIVAAVEVWKEMQ